VKQNKHKTGKDHYNSIGRMDHDAWSNYNQKAENFITFKKWRVNALEG